MDIQKVGVIGCGLMGSGITQVSAQCGYDVVVCEANQEILDKGLKKIDTFLTKSIERGKITEDQKKTTLDKIKGTTKLKDLKECDLIVEAIVLPVYTILYNINIFKPGLLIVILLCSIGYVSVGTLLATMAVQARTRDILLPILLFPLAVPVLIAAVKASGGFLQGIELAEIMPWLNLLIVYDVIFVAIALMVFDYVVEE